MAVIYNLGMAYYIGQEMSYLTGVIVFALQFAVTMDYALFLYHRYEQERVNHDNDKAMEVALVTTFKSVISAAATTTAGFLALTAMQLGFGMDMGMTLARGVVITVIAVLTILPALLLTFDGAVRRFSHRVFMPDFSRLGGWLARHAGAMTVVFALLFIPALWGYNQVVLDYNLDSALPEDLPSIQAQNRLAEEFGRFQTFFIMLEDTGSTNEIDALATRIGELEGVTEVFAYTEFVDPLIPEEFVPAEARENLFKNGYTYVSADVEYDFSDPRTLELLEELRDASEAYPGAAYVTGESVLYTDMEELSKDDVGRVNTISIIAIAIIVAIAFKSLSIPVVLLAVIQLAILFNQGLSGLSGQPIQFIAILAIGAIQLGATVDYAIILTTRYEEELRKSGDREDAMREALGGSAPSILTSAGTMFAATIGIVFLSSVTTISDLTMLIARGAVISFFVVVFLLPPLLVIGQPLYQWTSWGWPKASKKTTDTNGPATLREAELISMTTLSTSRTRRAIGSLLLVAIIGASLIAVAGSSPTAIEGAIADDETVYVVCDSSRRCERCRGRRLAARHRRGRDGRDRSRGCHRRRGDQGRRGSGGRGRQDHVDARRGRQA